MSQTNLGAIATIIAGQSPPGSTYNDVGDGLPFFQGKAEFGPVHPTPVKWCNLPTKIAEAGDILISVRAPVGPTNLAMTQCCIGRGLAAIRPDPAIADRDFVHWALIAARPRLEAKGNGSTFAAINRGDLATLPILLPGLDEQRRIVDLLSRAASLKGLAKEAQAKARELIPALFVSMFGDPATNPKAWPTSKLGDLGKLDRGKSKHRPRNDPVLYGGPHPFIQTGDVAAARGLIRIAKQRYSDAGLAQSRMWPAGTLCVTIAANIAQTGILTFPACFPDSVVGFTPNEGVNTRYVQHFIDDLRPYLELTAPQLAQKNINLEILREVEVPVPPIELQNQFAEHLDRVEGIEDLSLKVAIAAERTSAALMARLLAA